MGNVFNNVSKDRKPISNNYTIKANDNEFQQVYFVGETSQEETDENNFTEYSGNDKNDKSDKKEIINTYGITINEIMANLTFEKDNNIVNNLLELLEQKIINITTDELTLFWETHGNIILSKIKTNPEYCINLGMHLLPQQSKNLHVEKLGILIFNTHNDDAIVLLHNNMNKIITLMNRINKLQANFLANESVNNTKILEHAYKCLSIHKWGMAYVLFKKANDHKSAINVLESRAPKYMKILFGIQ